MSSELSHINKQGKANMVDVGDKSAQKREAKAEGFIFLQKDTIAHIRNNNLKKGDVLTVAKIAGIQAAKQTANLIPLCHSLILAKVDVDLVMDEKGVQATSMVKCTGQTGVEMEALTAVTVALLTMYDMCKAVDKKMVISNVKLVSKTKEDINPLNG